MAGAVIICVTMVRTLDPTKADLEAWRALVATASEPNAFFEPEVLLPAVRDLGGLGVELAVAESGGEWIGLLPVRRAGQWKRVPVSTHGVWRHRDCFFGAPLLAAGREDEALDELLRPLRSRANLVPLEYLPAEGPVADALKRVLDAAGVQPIVWAQWERAALHRRPEDDYVESMLSSKRRRELRRQRGHLERLLGAPVECIDASEDPAAVESFMRLEAGGWKGDGGTPLNTTFFRDACAGMRASGRLELLLLQAGKRVIAAKCNYIAGDGAFCFKIAYDETLAQFSPGVQLEIENVHAFHARPAVAWQDSCADSENQMINRIWPDRRRLESLLIPGIGGRGRVGRVQAQIALRARKAQRARASGRKDLDVAPSGRMPGATERQRTP